MKQVALKQCKTTLIHCVNMAKTKRKNKIMSVNQMAVYHMIMEVFNIIYNSSSEQIQNK